MVLYHAVSSYQLLEVMLHRMAFHGRQRAVLILPDFIVEKYPQYRRLREKRIFDEVYLFPYLRIPHRDEKQIMEDVNWYYNHLIPHNILEFSDIYVAGAHFYFSLYLIRQKRSFQFFEDAAGMLSRSDRLYEDLLNTYPVHAKVAQKYGLFDGSNPLIGRIICLKKAQTKDVSSDKYADFSVEEALEELSFVKRRKILRFFLRRRLKEEADAILMTQCFSNLGIMSQEEQREVYNHLKEKLPSDIHLLLKKHPDDGMDYGEVFPDADVIREIFPAELLPYVFFKRPEVIYTVDSTGCENLGKHFTIVKMERDWHGEEANLNHCKFSVPASDGGTYEKSDFEGERGGFDCHGHHAEAKRVCAASEGNRAFSEGFLWSDQGVKQGLCSRK